MRERRHGEGLIATRREIGGQMSEMRRRYLCGRRAGVGQVGRAGVAHVLLMLAHSGIW
jgi:hypothetical protein